MSRLNIHNDLFLALQELNRQQKFHKEDGYIRLFQSIINSFGIVNTDIDSSFDNFKVEGGTNVGTIKIAVDSYAVDDDIDIIFQEAIDNVAVTDDSNWYWVKVSHQEDNVEEGTIDLAVNGDITGTGTKFTEVLRDQSNYPVKMNFPGSASNTGDYQVVSILSDTQAVLSGSTGFTNENGLDYKVVGSFTPGINPVGDDRLPYFYDSCNLELILETVLDVPPAKTAGEEFYVARVQNIGGAMTIFDKRTEILASALWNNVVGGIAYLGGKVGIETIPIEKLDVNGATLIRGNLATGGVSGVYVSYDSSIATFWSYGSGPTTKTGFRFISRESDGGNSSTPLVIDGNDNIGINKPLPNSKLAVEGLPVYANNAAALVGGLTAGDFYKTAATGDANVNVTNAT